MMPTVASFLCYLKGLSPTNGWSGRYGIAFGSYGWAPVGPNAVSEQLGACGYEQPLGVLTHQWTEGEQSLAELQATIVEGIAALKAPAEPAE